MNLKELNSFKLSDAVTFHDKLNPKLWNGTKLRPEVRDQLIKIAEDFLQELGVHDLDVKDITISGSNAAYSYTKYSDLDLHILVDMGNLPVDEVYKELFLAKKTIYNESHDIKIHNIPVELYVQDSREPVVSLGEFSVLNDEWIKIPTKRRSDFDQTATKIKYEKLLSLIEIALKSRKYSKVKHIIDTIKRYRQAGLDKGGEFGPENLAYKMLRSQGYITKLYDLRDKLHSEILTVETMYQNIDEGFDQPYPITWEKGMHGDVDASAKLPDGTNLSIMFNKQDNIKPDDKTWMVEFYRNNSQEVTGEGDAQKVFATVLSAIQQFIVKYKPLKIYFSASKLLDPSINYGPDDVVPNPESRAKLYDRLVQRYAKAWGYRAFRGDTHASVMYELSRIPKQKAVGEDYTMQFAAEKTPVVSPYAGVKDNQYRGGMSEGLLDRFINTNNTKDKKINIGDYTVEIQTKNDKLFVYVTSAGEDAFDVAEAEFNIKLNNDGGKYLESEYTNVYPEYQRKGIATMIYRYVKSLGYDVHPSSTQTSKGKSMWKGFREKGVVEASGYIPSEKQKNDPRFKTALTVDVRPDSIKKNAKAFYWNISRAGIPPTAKANGKIS